MTATAVARTSEKTNIWLKELNQDLHWEHPDMVFRALRAVLHQLRDRLPTNEAAQLASQLPMLIRGVYYENWVPRPRPQHTNAKAFLAGVAQSFPSGFVIDPERITRAVFRLVSEHVSEGEIRDVRSCLPRDLDAFWP